VRDDPSTEEEALTAGTVEDPRKTTTYRVMLAVVIILGVLIVAAVGALIVGGIMKVSGHKAVGCVGDCGLAHLPPGARITSIQTTGNRLIIGLHTPTGDAVEIIDADTGHMVALIVGTPHGVPK
jgi:hypothetical protein